ncbi:hypothetical protein GCM10010275_12200 [Streptomyces litmocidini]|uniref:hypothetical protein n=1 Tax=Streptomyces litmocidini TaxID=67318 RepID=UPI00167D0814|nr:hypothetical protein [Streptomyces litmocidini]GGU78935.1 hypothetical protein GCM10010275_12200 [Streptomyces litmocidini]
MLRLRLRVTDWPRRALTLTDTPRPDCPRCDGAGGHAYDYGDPETGEYAGTEWDPCPCWHEDHSWALLPLPRRTPRGGYSDEPPF